MNTLSSHDVTHVDAQRRRVYLTGGRTLGFAQARRLGIDVEYVQYVIEAQLEAQGRSHAAAERYERAYGLVTGQKIA